MIRKVLKLQSKIRKLDFHQRMMLRDWMNEWYSDIQQQWREEE